MEGNLKDYEPLAQTVEHLTFNQGVRGSSPRWLTKNTRISGLEAEDSAILLKSTL